MTTPDRSAADALRARITGPVLEPGDDGYAEEVSGFDPSVLQRPAVVVGAVDAQDVAHALSVAREHGMPVSVMGTGHADVRPVTDGMMLTLRRLGAVTLDRDSASVTMGAGADWHDVLAVTKPHSLAPLCGSAPGVGAVGLILGGGSGPIGRTYGFTADHVAAFEVVTATGELLTVDADRHPDLFWALRGGKGALAVVVSATLQLLPLSEIWGGSWHVAGDDIPAVLDAYRAFTAADVPPELTTSLAIVRLPDLPVLPPVLRGATVGHVRVGYVGDPAAGDALLAPLRSAAPAVAGGVARLPYDQIGTIHNDPVVGMPHTTGGLLLREFPPAAAAALLELAGPGVSSPLTLVEIRHLGGAFAQVVEPANAVGGRDAAFGVWVSAVVPPRDAQQPTGRRPYEAAVRSVLDALAPWSTGGAQINFLGDTNTADEFAHAWTPDVSARLAAVRRHYDPAGVLRYRPV